MRANIRRMIDEEETGDLVQLPGEHKTVANLVCYGVVPYARKEWNAKPGDKISVCIYANSDLSRSGDPDQKIVVTLDV